MTSRLGKTIPAIGPLEGSSALSVLDNQATLGMRKFLLTLSTENLFAITKTSTGGLIIPTSVEDAITIITKYSDAVSLLNRRRVKREHMARYLHKENVKIQLPADKTQLCHYILNHWGLSHSQTRNYRFQDDQDPVSSTLGESTRKTISQSRSVASSQNTTQNSSMKTEIFQDDNMEDESIEMNMGYATQTHQQTGQELAEQFAPWFYSKWNNLNDFDPRHFWSHCNLRVEVIQPEKDTTVKEIYQNGTECCQFMRELILIEQLVMNPNLLDGLGVSGKVNPHGLAQVFVCGTAYKNRNPFGIFEQVFGLLKDPECENNFKIQFSMIRFRGTGGMLESPPTLQNSSIGCMIEDVSD